MPAGDPLVAGEPGEDFSVPTLPPDDDSTPNTYDKYDWQYYYETPKWKDFDPSAKLEERLSSAPPAPPRRFREVTAGEMVKEIMEECHARGALRDISFDFTENRDSAGNKWPKNKEDLITHVWEAGTTNVAMVVSWLFEQGFARAKMNGRTLQLFDYSYFGDKTADVILAKGKNLVDGPMSGSARDFTTHAYVMSESGVHGWVNGGDDIKTLIPGNRRVEAVVPINGVREWEQAAARGRKYIDRYGKIRQQLVFGIVPSKGADPYTDFGIGDMVTLMDNGVPKTHRVKQIGMQWDATNTTNVVVTLSDVILPVNQANDRRLKATRGRSAHTIQSRVSGRGSDGIAPEAPSAPIVESKSSTLQITWDGRDRNGGEPVWDQEMVEVHISTDDEFVPSAATLLTVFREPNTIAVNNLPYQQENFVKLVAVDDGGDRSSTSVSTTAILAQVNGSDIQPGSIGGDVLDPELGVGGDGEPPAYSPLPVITGGIGSLFVTWTEPANSSPMKYRVFITEDDSTDPDTIAPDDPDYLIGTVFGTLMVIEATPGGFPLAPGVEYYVWLVAEDVDGVADPSAMAAGTVIESYPAAEYDEFLASQAALADDLGDLEDKFPIESTDIADDAITTPKIIAGAIITSKMTAGSISGDRISANTMDASKILAGTIYTALMGANTINGDRITAGTLHANKITAGTITALEISAGAISTSKLTATAIDGMTITGAFVKTGASGAYIRLYDNGGLGTIEFHNTSGVANGYIFGNSSTSGATIQGGTVTLSVSGSGVEINNGPLDMNTGNINAVTTINSGGGALNLGGGLSFTSWGSVSRGAVDSGGSGFRLLRVTNS